MKIYLQAIWKEKKMSIEQLSEQLSEQSGVAKSYIQKIEADCSSPSIAVMCRLAKALQVPIYDLFSCEEE